MKLLAKVSLIIVFAMGLPLVYTTHVFCMDQKKREFQEAPRKKSTYDVLKEAQEKKRSAKVELATAKKLGSKTEEAEAGLKKAREDMAAAKEAATTFGKVRFGAYKLGTKIAETVGLKRTVEQEAAKKAEEEQQRAFFESSVAEFKKNLEENQRKAREKNLMNAADIAKQLRNFEGDDIAVSAIKKLKESGAGFTIVEMHEAIKAAYEEVDKRNLASQLDFTTFKDGKNTELGDFMRGLGIPLTYADPRAKASFKKEAAQKLAEAAQKEKDPVKRARLELYMIRFEMEAEKKEAEEVAEKKRSEEEQKRAAEQAERKRLADAELLRQAEEMRSKRDLEVEDAMKKAVELPPKPESVKISEEDLRLDDILKIEGLGLNRATLRSSDQAREGVAKLMEAAEKEKDEGKKWELRVYAKKLAELAERRKAEETTTAKPVSLATKVKENQEPFKVAKDEEAELRGEIESIEKEQAKVRSLNEEYLELARKAPGQLFQRGISLEIQEQNKKAMNDFIRKQVGEQRAAQIIEASNKFYELEGRKSSIQVKIATNSAVQDFLSRATRPVRVAELSERMSSLERQVGELTKQRMRILPHGPYDPSDEALRKGEEISRQIDKLRSEMESIKPVVEFLRLQEEEKRLRSEEAALVQTFLRANPNPTVDDLIGVARKFNQLEGVLRGEGVPALALIKQKIDEAKPNSPERKKLEEARDLLVTKLIVGAASKIDPDKARMADYDRVSAATEALKILNTREGRALVEKDEEVAKAQRELLSQTQSLFENARKEAKSYGQGWVEGSIRDFEMLQKKLSPK